MNLRLSPEEAYKAVEVLRRRRAHVAHAIRALELLQRDKTFAGVVMEIRRPKAA